MAVAVLYCNSSMVLASDIFIIVGGEGRSKLSTQ